MAWQKCLPLGKRAQTLPEVLDREEIFELHAQGVQAIYTRIDTSLARLDAHAGRGSPDRRPSSETSVTGRRAGSFVRQSTFARTGSMKREAVADMPSGATLQRLYTIDQDAFFPDLPPLVQVGTSAISLGCCGALHAHPANWAGHDQVSSRQPSLMQTESATLCCNA